jgi:hypothetical protein
VTALVAGSLALSLVGDTAAATAFLLSATALLALALTTRYSRPPARH